MYGWKPVGTETSNVRADCLQQHLSVCASSYASIAGKVTHNRQLAPGMMSLKPTRRVRFDMKDGEMTGCDQENMSCE